ncbi:hypothetical protein Q671_01105 [Halomonas sp. PBN3]|nr:hypothetical protein Q671_01105 [Halomonas sp. PBN3]
MATDQPGLQQRAGQPLEELARQALEARLATLAEHHPQGEGIAGQALVAGQVTEQRGQGVQLQVDQCLARQLVEGLHRGQHPLAAGLGQQRDVVAGAQVVELAAQVDHVGGALTLGGGAVAWVQREVRLGGDQVLAGVVGLPVGEAVDDDTQGAHGRGLPVDGGGRRAAGQRPACYRRTVATSAFVGEKIWFFADWRESEAIFGRGGIEKRR